MSLFKFTRLSQLCLLLSSAPLFCQSIGDKKASLHKDAQSEDSLLNTHNKELATLRSSLKSLYEKAGPLYLKSASERDFEVLLQEINVIKEKIQTSEKKWFEKATYEQRQNEEGLGTWDQEETNLGQLIMEYGASDFLFVIPPEIALMKLNLHSGISIPRESWSSMLELILSQNGIGMKEINSYAKQLYSYKQDPSAVQAIVTSPEDLKKIPANDRLFYVFSPPAEQIKGVFQFCERFSDPKQTSVYVIGSKVVVVSFREEIEKLNALYRAIWEAGKGKVSRVVAPSKLSVKDAEKILHAFFGENAEKLRSAPPMGRIEPEGLTTMILPEGGGLVLIGQKDLVDRAEKVIRDTENQLEDPSQMTVFWYTCKHSDASEVAELLEKVYDSLITSNISPTSPPLNPPQRPAQKNPLEKLYREDDNSGLVVNPSAALPGHIPSSKGTGEGNHFIPYPKTGMILMVIRRDSLDKIKEILKKIDTPKKMVQIEVVLFEKKLTKHSNFGINLLRLGAESNHESKTGALFFGGGGRDLGKGKSAGIFEFLISRKHHNWIPAFDLAYQFLMAQDDVRINAAPSVTTVNQTPTTISIVDEISINNGASPVQTSNGEVIFEKSFTRSQYGITIVITPTIHLPDVVDEDNKALVTLETNITFDTPKLHTPDDRPTVPRRHIETEVRVVDGQTLILGGLRRRLSEDVDEKIPFFGEIPGIAKFFGFNKMMDQTTEMFVFITPRVIVDPLTQVEQLQVEELKRRPGDLPEFLNKLKSARDKEKHRLFEDSVNLLFGSANHGW